MSIDHLTIAEFTIQPGGDAGWQRHGGPVWVIVERGTLTLYVEQDQSCDAVGYASGSAFLVSGNVRHTMRNEERELLRFHLVSMLAERESMRSDGSMPTHCRFQAKRAKP